VHAIGKLQKRFPAAFPKKPEPKLPLKVGIFEDLLPHAEQLGLSEAEIREAIATWCRGSRYWTCLTDGAARVDLNGAPAGMVNARDVAFARNSQRGGPRRPRAEGAAGGAATATATATATAKGEAAERAAAEGSEGEAHSNAAPAVEAPVLAQPGEASGAAVEAQLPGDATAAATAPEQLQNHAATGVEASASADLGASAEASASAESTAQAASTDAAEAPNPATPGAATAAASEKAHANP
jgi:ProP effector